MYLSDFIGRIFIYVHLCVVAYNSAFVVGILQGTHPSNLDNQYYLTAAESLQRLHIQHENQDDSLAPFLLLFLPLEHVHKALFVCHYRDA